MCRLSAIAVVFALLATGVVVSEAGCASPQSTAEQGPQEVPCYLERPDTGDIDPSIPPCRFGSGDAGR